MIPTALSALSGIAGAAVLGVASQALRAGSKRYVVARLDASGGIVGRSFSSLEEAKARQFELASKGFGSILLEKSGESGLSLKPILGMTSSGKMISGERILASRGEMTSDPPRHRPPAGFSVEGPSSKSFDTLEEQQRVISISTRFPSPEWAVRKRFGPFPETSPFVLNPSSHEWGTAVSTWAVPERFMHDRNPVSQPSVLTVE